MEVEIKIKKINPAAVIPHYAQVNDACVDLTAITKTVVNEKGHGYIEYGTGLTMEIPTGYEGIIRPRSSISNTGLIMRNSPGTIDSDYRGEIKVRFLVVPGSTEYIEGDRIAQMTIKEVVKMKFVEAEELSDTRRGTGGFGSTGK